MPNNVLNQPPDASSAAGPSTTQASASTSKQSTTERIMGKLGGPFSRPKTPSTRPTTPQPIAAIHTNQQQHLRDGVTDTPITGGLTSKQAETVPEAAITEQQHPTDEVTHAPSAGKLTSKQAEAVPEATTTTNKKKVLALELGISAIDLLTEVSDIAVLFFQIRWGIFWRRLRKSLAI